MRKKYVNELKNYTNQEITISGFIDVVRDKKWVMFVVLRDSTGKVQLTIEKSDENNKDILDLLSNTTHDSVIEVSGIVKENSAVKLGGLEIIPKVEVYLILETFFNKHKGNIIKIVKK